MDESVRICVRKITETSAESTCVRSNVDLERALAVETFTTVATSMLVVVPVAMATCDASYWITSSSAH